jgi:hypothetical protein
MSHVGYQFETADETTKRGKLLNQVTDILNQSGFKDVEFFWLTGKEKYPESSVHFQGNRSEGFRALVVLMQSGIAVGQLSRVWPVEDGEPMGPHWLITFPRQAHEQAEAASE